MFPNISYLSTSHIIPYVTICRICQMIKTKKSSYICHVSNHSVDILYSDTEWKKIHQDPLCFNVSRLSIRTYNIQYIINTDNNVFFSTDIEIFLKSILYSLKYKSTTFIICSYVIFTLSGIYIISIHPSLLPLLLNSNERQHIHTRFYPFVHGEDIIFETCGVLRKHVLNKKYNN
jgi:hypothetical protein